MTKNMNNGLFTNKKTGHLIVVILVLIFVLVIHYDSYASTTLPDSIYIKGEAGSQTCTLASAVMMMRARAYLSGYSDWASITEWSTASDAWIQGVGLSGSWTHHFNGNYISATNSGEIHGISIASLKTVLNSHPEGIVLYCGNAPHAVFVTDYEGDTFYCADPYGGSYSYRRLKLSDSALKLKYNSQAMILQNVTKYWFISSYSINASIVDFDVNATLDGTLYTSLGAFGTCDVYIGIKGQPGYEEQLGVTDFNGSYKGGTHYKVVGHANPGYIYEGRGVQYWGSYVSGPLEGEIEASHTNKICLAFSTDPNGYFHVVGLLDGILSDDLTGYATFDVWIDGINVAQGVSHYSGSYPIGKQYEIRNVRPTENKVFDSLNSNETGNITSGETRAVVAINSIGNPTNEWQYCYTLPGNLNLDITEIQYKNFYETIAETSPGKEWLQGQLSSSTYENAGDAYTVLKPETTSDTLKLVKWEYFHWCNPSGGNIANYAYDTSKGYTHEDVISNTDSVTEAQQLSDNGYWGYYLKWKSSGNWAYCHGGITCNTSHDNRTYVWYKRYTYQKLRKVEKWLWTKESDWQNNKDTNASRVEYRYRLKVPTVDWEFVLPGKMTVISREAFAGDSSIISVKLGPSVKTIEGGAFADCSNLNWIYIPDSVISIDEEAFTITDNITFICESENYGAEYAGDHGIRCIVEKHIE